MKRGQTAVGVFGVLATLFGVALLLVPDRVNVGPVTMLAERVSATETTTVLLVTGAVVGLALVLLVVPGRHGPRSPTPTGNRFEVAIQSEQRPVEQQDPVGTALYGVDTRRAIEEGGAAFDALQAVLVSLTVDVYADTTGRTDEQARQAVNGGDWTGDRLAVATLRGSPPPLAQARLLLAPTHERRRRIERTVTAIEQMQGRTATEQMQGRTATEQMQGRTATEQMQGQTATEQMQGQTATEQMQGR